MRAVSERNTEAPKATIRVNAEVDRKLVKRVKVKLIKRNKTVSDAVRECFEQIAKS